MKVQIVNKSNNPLPEYASILASGMDVRANEVCIVKAHAQAIVGTGLFVAIPEGYEIQVRPRSGLAAKQGITVLNSPGTIDADYRGEIKVILVNHSGKDVVVNVKDRIAQLVLSKVPHIEWESVDELPSTERGEGGLGSTGN